MKKVDRTQARHHLDRAESFRRAMIDLRDLADDLHRYGYAVALLAVHAAISVADAVLIAYTGRRSNDRDHRTALGALRELCGLRGADREGIRQLGWLLSRKTDFAYGDKRIDLTKDVAHAKDSAERFFAWAYRQFPEIGRIEADNDPN
jgi:hypothetical protein